jgi:hypothetical protein
MSKSNRKTNNVTLSKQLQSPIEKQICHSNCFDSVALFVFLLDFDIVPTVWHYLFLLDFGTIICFSMGFWNYSHSVALSVYLLYFGTDQTVWHDFFFYGTFIEKQIILTLSELFQSTIEQQIMAHCQ